MKVRKRTRSGKSQKMEVQEHLSVVAQTDHSKTIQFTPKYYDTEFNIELTKNECIDLGLELTNWGQYE